MIYAVSLSFYTWLVQLYASMDVRIFFMLPHLLYSDLDTLQEQREWLGNIFWGQEQFGGSVDT